MKKTDTKVNTKETKVIDASGRTLGRVATEVAFALSGKNKVSFERNVYSGSPVLVTNASKIKITTKKLEELQHARYSGYPGGLRIIKGAETVKTKGYKELISLAVDRMLPSNKLHKEMMKNLKVQE